MDTSIVLPAPLQKIIRKKTLLISLAIIALGCLIAYNLYKMQSAKLKEIKNQIAVEEQRMGLGRELNSLNEQVSNLRRPYLKGGGGLTIEKFNELASLTGTKIVSIIPEPERSSGLYSSALFNLKLQADYPAISAFLDKLEAQPGMVKVEEFSLKLLPRDKKGHLSGAENKANLLEINLKVNAIFLKDES